MQRSTSAALVLAVGLALGFFTLEAHEGAAGTQSTRAATLLRFAIPYFKSSTTSGFRSATAVTILNTSNTGACQIQLRWGGSVGASASCTQGVLLGVGTRAEFCSRQISSAITGCMFACSPDLNREGVISILTADAVECSKLKVDSRIYYLEGTTADGAIRAVSNTRF